MKKITALFVALCSILTLITISACAYENYVENLEDDAYAVILDAEGNVIETLDLEVSVEQISNTRSAAPMYTITYTASDNVKSDSDATGKDGVTATGVITWTDNLGPDNTLNSVSGYWIASNRTISNRTVKYGAKNILQEEIDAPFYAYPDKDDFKIEQNNISGYQFYLFTMATINETGNTIVVHAITTVTAT